MADRPFENGVTVGIIPSPDRLDKIMDKMETIHDGAHDTLVVFVPKGMAKAARDRIWSKLEEAPRQSQREFARDQATAYEGNIARMAAEMS